MRVVHTVIKMALAGVITSLVTKALNLDYWITAGILAVLSTQLTKRESFIIAGKRIGGTILGLVLSFLMFYLFGQHFWVFAIIILLFAFASFLLQIPEGIVPVLVLISHILEADQLQFKVFLNEFLIMGIAIVVVLILDLIYPKQTEKEFKRFTSEIDQLLQEHIIVLARFVNDEIQSDEAYLSYTKLDERFKHTYNEATLLDKDLLFSKSTGYLSYLQMRNEQIKHLDHIYQHALKLETKHQYATQIKTFLMDLSEDIGYDDKASSQLEKLNEFKEYFKGTKLPQTRAEFETRAMLYQMLNEIEYFLEVKIQFHINNPHFYKRSSNLLNDNV